MQKTENRIEQGVRIIPLGGLERIGMNMTAIEYGGTIVVVDCGMAFPEEDMLGIDIVLPDITYLEENLEKVKGFVITHGHEDHIGAIPYILEKVNVPIYATRLTMALIDRKLEDRNFTGKVKKKTVRYGQTVSLGDIRVEFIRTNHSIQDAAALAIYTPEGLIVHTGDFKIDYTPVHGDAIDLQRFALLGKKGVLALLCDSTNAVRPGSTLSEKTVGDTFDRIFRTYVGKRMIIATFSSNVDRVQQIINCAARVGRKVCLEGRSMINVIGTALQLGYVVDPYNTLITVDQLGHYKPGSVVLVTTGSQGESMAALSRMAANLHKQVKIMPGDVVLFSSHPIPGNEKAVANVINELAELGAEVLFEDAHVSGHACQEDIKLMYALLQPKYAVPIHGEMMHLQAQAGIAETMGIQKKNIFVLHCGDVLTLNQDVGRITDKVTTGTVLVDGLGVGDVGNVVIRDRQRLSEDGVIAVVMTLDSKTDEVLSGPEIISRGFVYVREAEDLMEEAQAVVEDALIASLRKRKTDRMQIKNNVREALSGFVWEKTERRPMILPIIMEADI